MKHKQAASIRSLRFDWIDMLLILPMLVPLGFCMYLGRIALEAIGLSWEPHHNILLGTIMAPYFFVGPVIRRGRRRKVDDATSTAEPGFHPLSALGLLFMIGAIIGIVFVWVLNIGSTIDLFNAKPKSIPYQFTPPNIYYLEEENITIIRHEDGLPFSLADKLYIRGVKERCAIQSNSCEYLGLVKAKGIAQSRVKGRLEEAKALATLKADYKAAHLEEVEKAVQTLASEKSDHIREIIRMLSILIGIYALGALLDVMAAKQRRFQAPR